MTREQLLALGLEESVVDAIIKMHGVSIQNLNATIATNNAEISRLQSIEANYNNLLNSQNNIEPEPQDPALQQAMDRIAELEEQNLRNEIKNYAVSQGLSGEDIENVLSAFSSNLESAKSAIDSIAKVISARETAAADAKVKEIANNTTNPNGGDNGDNNPPDKPDDVANAEGITFATIDKNAQSARDYYK